VLRHPSRSPSWMRSTHTNRFFEKKKKSGGTKNPSEFNTQSPSVIYPKGFFSGYDQQLLKNVMEST
jgi:hypothetical protein